MGGGGGLRAKRLSSEKRKVMSTYLAYVFSACGFSVESHGSWERTAREFSPCHIQTERFSVAFCSPAKSD